MSLIQPEVDSGLSLFFSLVGLFPNFDRICKMLLGDQSSASEESTDALAAAHHERGRAAQEPTDRLDCGKASSPVCGVVKKWSSA